MGVGKEVFLSVHLKDIRYNYKDCKGCRLQKVRELIMGSMLPLRMLKFNVDGAVTGKPAQQGLEVNFATVRGKVLYMFSKHVGVRDSRMSRLS